MRRDALTPGEAAKLWHATRGDPRARLLIGLQMFCGLRACEVARAEAGDIIFNERGKAIALRVQGKGRKRKDASVAIPACLRPYLPARGPLIPNLHDPIKPLSPRGLHRIVAYALRYLAKIRRPGVTPHSLRHTAATEALRAGFSLGDISAFLRHQSLSSTMWYLHGVKEVRCPEHVISRRLIRRRAIGHAKPTSS